MFKREKPSEYPTITFGRYHTQDGNIYIKRDDGGGAYRSDVDI